MLMNASVLATPCACCSAPRAVSTIADRDRPSRCAARTMSASGTPVMRSTRPGQHAATARPHCREASGALRDVRLVHQAVADEDVQQPVGEHAVGAGHERQVQCRRRGRGCAARIDDDQVAAGAALRVEVLHGRRQRLGDVAADEEDGLGLGDVGERERQPAIQAERRVGGGRRRRHAEAAVVIDVPCAERHARELPEQVRLLVGERAAAEHANRVLAVAGLQRTDGRRRCGRGPRPRWPVPARRRRCGPAATSTGRDARARRPTSSP